MRISSFGTGAAALAIALFASGARAASADRLGAVVSDKIELQRQISEWLTNALRSAAEPYRIDVMARVEMRGFMRELHQKQGSDSPAVKIGGASKVKLPGLGMVQGGGSGGPLIPEISIEGGKTNDQVTRQLETEVSRLTITLLVDKEMPEDRREYLKEMAADLVQLDTARGDEVIVKERPPTPVGAPRASPFTIQGTIEAPPKHIYELLLMCGTAVLAALLHAFVSSRRGGSMTLKGAFGGGGGRAVASASGGAEGPQAAAVTESQRKRREEVGAFDSLADATPKEIAQLIAEVDVETAVAVIDLYGVPSEAAELLDGAVTPERRVQIALKLGSAKILSREKLRELEGDAAKALERIRDRIPLGGPGRLADFLSHASESVRQEVFDAVKASDESLARAARSVMLLFEDLPKLVDASLKQIAAAIDPATLALALVGAPESRQAVLGAVSPRARRMIEAEEETSAGRPPEEIEKARRAVEEAMRAVQARGELKTRPTDEPPAATSAAA